MVTLSKATFAVVLLLLAPMLYARSERVTMNFEGVSLSEAVTELIAQTGLSFGTPPDPALNSRLGLGVQIRGVPVNVALEAFAVAYQVCFFQSPQFVHVRRCSSGAPKYY